MDPGHSQNVSYGGDQLFCLRWSNHQSNMLNVFNQLRYNESFVDVTLAVEGRVLKAHKMVLSACSPYFQRMFEMTPDKHPVVFIDRVFYQDMKRLLEFMYRGEVSVDQGTLTRFLKVARSLKIRGLTDIEEPPLNSAMTFSHNGGSSVMSCINEEVRHRRSEPPPPPASTSSGVSDAQGRVSASLSRSVSGTPVRQTTAETDRSRSVSEESATKFRRVSVPSPGHSSAVSVSQESESGHHQASTTSCPSEKRRRMEVAQDLRTDTDRDKEEPHSPPVTIKQEQDVYCQPDIWVSEGIFVEGQQQVSGASSSSCVAPGTPNAVPLTTTSQSGGRSTASPGSSALEDALSSPEDSGPVLDYVTHEDGSVTCKLCGEQVPSRNHWYRHKYRTHAWHTYKCDDCGITYKSKRGFEAHLEAKHERELPLPSSVPPAVSPPAPGPGGQEEGEPVEGESEVRRRDWEGVARALEHSRKRREEELVSDIIRRVKRECAMEGEDYTRRGYVKHF